YRKKVYACRIKSEYNFLRAWASGIKASVIMADRKLLQFPMRYPALFVQEINQQVLRNSEFNQVLYAAIRALPHVQDSLCREELNRDLCDIRLQEDGAACPE